MLMAANEDWQFGWKKSNLAGQFKVAQMLRFI